MEAVTFNLFKTELDYIKDVADSKFNLDIEDTPRVQVLSERELFPGVHGLDKNRVFEVTLFVTDLHVLFFLGRCYGDYMRRMEEDAAHNPKID